MRHFNIKPGTAGFAMALFTLVMPGITCCTLLAQGTNLEQQLLATDVAELVEKVHQLGDAARGAMLYYTPELACVRCHEPAENSPRLGPEIAQLNRDATTEYLIQSLLLPSQDITEGFQSHTFLTLDGKLHTGLLTNETPSAVTLTDPNRDGQQTTLLLEDVEERKLDKLSAMPTGLVSHLGSQQQFFDLLRYLVEIKRGGVQAVLKLRPPDSFFAVAPLPEYESHVDHAQLIRSLFGGEGTAAEPNEVRDSLSRGEAIYNRFCARCHGTQDQPGSMPTARKFAEGEFKNGADPYNMYTTLTHGYGLMVAQRWMVPQQKYDVIHYIHKRYIAESQQQPAFKATDAYVAALPAGDTLGPDPVDRRPWSDMDYGPSLINSYEVGEGGTNIAYKGIAVRLDEGPGGVSQGRHWIMYEHDTMRVAAAWSGTGFIDWRGIHFNDEHNQHPSIVGDVHFANPTGPGWADPQTGSLVDDQRVVGRDQRRYGPLPAAWLKYRGIYHFENRTILDYSVGQTEILETPSLKFVDNHPVFVRTLNLGPRQKNLLLKLATLEDLAQVKQNIPANAICFERSQNGAADTGKPYSFDGLQYLVSQQSFAWNRALTVLARIKTKNDGTIICQTANQAQWVPGGTSLFIRGGRLVFDIGWVGAVTSEQRVNDNRWHTVALVWQPDDQSVKLFVDGQLDGVGELKLDKRYDNPVVRIGYTSENFPQQSAFKGRMSDLRVYDRALSKAEIASVDLARQGDRLVANWKFPAEPAAVARIDDSTGNQYTATWLGANSRESAQIASYWSQTVGLEKTDWKVLAGVVCLEIPAGSEPLNIEIASGTSASRGQSLAIINQLNSDLDDRPVADLRPLTRGGKARYRETLVGQLKPGDESGPFAVDVIVRPTDNPWAARLRLTGLDFFDDDTAAVCTWDGSVWRLSGLKSGTKITWQRIAAGLFQPLGIRIVDGTPYVSCRDQIVALEDLNGDGETDFYRAFNSDHQVTEHFHEFAMGLQRDDQGNFYYAKSARHAKTALVPHHGTLLKVDATGSKTDILAVGFRAANGVCINPDGSFYVTDQEGHWNPKNRINWVEPGGFYGNMYGYHQIEDSSDEAMQQPLCWITNAFDRSPGELLWVDSQKWEPLYGSLLNLSYGMGQIFVVPHESVELRGRQQLQGGMCALPIDLFPTGVMRGRFSPFDGQLYACGMYAWAGNQQQPGGMYRIRYTGKPVHLPLSLRTSGRTVRIKLSGKLDRSVATQPQRYLVKVWDIRRSKDYGSPHIDEHELAVTGAVLLDDQQTIELTIPGLGETKCMEIKYSLKSMEGRDVINTIHNTIHAIGK